jgi:hypothetical protein
MALMALDLPALERPANRDLDAVIGRKLCRRRGTDQKLRAGIDAHARPSVLRQAASVQFFDPYAVSRL